MKNYRFALSLALVLAISAVAGAFAPSGNEKTSGVNIGQPVADFKLPDADGKEHSLASLKGKNGTVIIFISAQCPMVKAYNERIEKLAQDYRTRGVNVIGINSNVTESTDDIKGHISNNKFSFAVLRDKGNKIADKLGAERTPEVYFLDASNKLAYHGRIDNHRDVTLVQANDLRDAIDATLAGKPVVKTEAAAFGCSIKRG
ncbi:MAG: thioredoxin family protein [Acidobacteria bacterium]|jgi:peroxiredoxin|nr:thioredoxin family protein [Acidobacteriota bacterium]